MFILYNSEKYKVLIGNHPNIGFCTVWNEPHLIFDKIKENTGITSTLYSKYGINIIFRNLALNPQINKLYIWANGNLSNTELGKRGFTTLKTIWETKTVNNEDFELEEGIDEEVVKTIINNVELIDLSDKNIEEVIEILSKTPKTQTKYMEPVQFAEPAKKDYETFPSEMVGFLVRGQKIADAWSKAVERIMRYGENTGTQYGYRQKQLVALNWVIENEDPNNLDLKFLQELPNTVKQTIVADLKSLEQYNREVFEKSEKQHNLAYTYGNRMRAYPNGNEELNQVEIGLLNNLKSSVNSRRAAITTIVPSVDLTSSEPPCLSLVQALYADNKLNLIVTFRSHDIFKAGISNAFGLLKLQDSICKQLKITKGSLQINSVSAHIYEQDWKDATDLCKCLYWDREPNLFWDHTQNSDPRGNFLINIVDKKIEITLQGPKGESLLTISGINAKYLCLKLAQLDLISRIDHAMDVAQQIQKAEIALNKGIDFVQDQPLKL